MTDFLESPSFPGCPSFGFVAQPDYNNTITVLAGGAERRNRLWARPRHRYTATIGPRLQEEIEDLLTFWHAVGGTECGFRFKDFADYKTCRLAATPTARDQPVLLVEDGSSESQWQLAKRYSAGPRSQIRYISKPLANTVRIANQFGNEQTNDRWSLDATTGIVTPGLGFVGVPATWGGEFDVPVRFDSEFPVELSEQRIQSVQIALLELRPQ